MNWTLAALNPAMQAQAREKLSALGKPKLVRPMGEPKTGESGPKPNKYHARRVEVDGLKFDSQYEHRCYVALKIRQRAGEIEDLRCQVKFALFDAGGHCRGEYIGTYRADFTYRENGHLVVADAKSAHTRTLRDWPRTKALLKMCHGYEVVEL